MKVSFLPWVAAAAVLIVALIAGPRSCAGGLELYLLAGVVAWLVCLLLPLWLRPRGRRLAIVAGGTVLVALAWLGGIVLGNFQLLCRLF